jgi:hypothetical protein
LREEERELLTLEGNRHARHVEPNINCGAVDSARYDANAVRMFDAIVARSTPPEVVKPSRLMYTVSSQYAHGWDECDRAYRSAIAAAGVPMKEVGK